MTRIEMTALAALMATVAGAGTALADGRGPHGMMGGERLDFAVIDTDGDGSLSRAELEARATARIAEADTDGDGILTRDELIAVMPGADAGFFRVFSPDPAERMANRMLAMMGATEAGQVEVATVAGHRVNMILAFVDTDNDAAISQAEADAMKAHRHARGRGDRDGHGPRWGRPGPGPEGPGPRADAPGAEDDGDGPSPSE